MIIFYLYYAVFLVAAIAIAVLSYKALRHRSRFWAASFSIVPVIGLVLLYPIPIHGGVTFLIEILIEDCQPMLTCIFSGRLTDLKSVQVKVSALSPIAWILA